MKKIYSKIESELDRLNLASAFVVLTKIKTTNQDIDPYFIVDSKLGNSHEILDISNDYDDKCKYVLSFYIPHYKREESIKFIDNIVTSFDIKSNMKVNHTYCHMFKVKDGYINSEIVESKARFSKAKNVTEPVIYGE